MYLQDNWKTHIALWKLNLFLQVKDFIRFKQVINVMFLLVMLWQS